MLREDWDPTMFNQNGDIFISVRKKTRCHPYRVKFTFTFSFRSSTGQLITSPVPGSPSAICQLAKKTGADKGIL